MKKTSIVVKEKDRFEINILINNTAYIKSVTGKTGLLNIKTNQIIGEMDNYYTIYDTDGEFYYQEKEIEEPNDVNGNRKKTLRVYDAQKEKILVDGWEVVKNFSYYYQLTAVKSPIDGKIHLFDRYSCRTDTNIFDMALDDVEFLYRLYNDTYLVVTINGKKGIYHSNYDKVSSLITPIEFDNIEKFTNIVVYTNNKQKYFIYDEKNNKKSLEFDEIVLDEKRKNIVYCKKGSRIYVYNTESQELLLNEECNDIKFLGFRSREDHGYRCENFYFAIIKNNLKGLSETITGSYSNKVGTSNRSLLPAKYDDIEYDNGDFYLKKDEKTGIFKLHYRKNILVEPYYDKIEDLGCGIYAFYYEDRCDIYKIVDSLEQLIKNCKIISTQKEGLIFEQNNLCGILYQGLSIAHLKYKDVIVDNYDNVSYLGDGYYQVEKDGKKGVNFRSQDIIPMEYDTIDMKLSNNKSTTYFALGKEGFGLELAKKRHREYEDNDVELINFQIFEEINLFENIMTLRTKTNLLIYDYEEKLLKKLPATSQVSMICRNPNNDYNKKPLYVIDGNLHYYKDGKFEEVFFEENDLYITTYETATDSFEIKTFDKAEHDSFCDIIDSQDDSIAEQALIDIFENSRNEVRQQHNTLVLKRIKK